MTATLKVLWRELRNQPPFCVRANLEPKQRDSRTGKQGAARSPVSIFGWEMWPNAFNDMLRALSRDYDHPIIEITETGMPYPDTMSMGKQMNGAAKIEWCRQHLAAPSLALNNGARVRAYHAWSLLDNLGWGSGYTWRFGLVHVDFKTLNRTIKDSDHWERRAAGTNSLDM